ncbi:MAG: hypothetical protein AB8G22_08210 [Saprospiraceae bacterium]
MSKFFKKLFLFLFIGLIIALVGAIVIVSTFGDALGQEVLKNANKQLKSELSVAEVDISVISTFPSAAVNLRNVKMADARGGILLEADNMAFKFGLFSLFSSAVKVKEIVAEDGALTIYIDKNGRSNYDVLKETENGETTDSEGKTYGFSLDEAVLKNIELIYQDESLQQDLVGLIDKATFSGAYTGDKFNLSSTAEMQSKFFELEGTRYFVGKPLSYKAQVAVDFATGLYALDNVVFSVNDNEFGINGTIKQSNKFSDYDIKVTSEEGTLTSILQLLPEEYLEYFGDFTSTGNFLFDADITGRAGINESPGFVANVNLADGRISSPRLQNDLKDVSFEAIFSNGAERVNSSSYFRISNLKGYFNRELVELDFELRNFDDPDIDMTLDGVVPLEAVYGLMSSPAITDGDGEIEVKQFKLKGRYADMVDVNRIGQVEASGQLEFDDAELTINDEEVVFDKGDLILSDNTLSVKDVEFNGADSEIYLDGSFYNLIPVLLADSLNSKNSELKFTAVLNAPKIDLAKLVSLTEVPVEKGAVSTFEYDSLQVENTEQREFITKFLKGTFDATVEEFSYNLIEGTDFKGRLDFSNNEMTIKGATQAMDGSIDLNGTMFFEKEPYLKAKFIANDIDFHEFFRQSENFGQEVLVDENVGGRLSTKMLINAYFDQTGNFLYDKLYVLAGIGIQDGELKDFEMLEDFSTYVKIDDLRHIKFANEENYLEIKNENIHIPVMFIESNALNLTIGGDHSFENEFDYNLKINAGQVIANRFKKHNPDQTPQKAKRNGWFNIYYKIHGDLDKYEYESARKEVKRDFAQSEQRKRIVKSKLAREFGTVNFLEEPLEWRDIPNVANDDEDYIDGFEDLNGGK